jgi:hypothetical protein
MCNKILAWVFSVLAIILAILAVSLPAEKLMPIINISRFFEVMIPVLAVGALVKYIWTWCCEKK